MHAACKIYPTNVVFNKGWIEAKVKAINLTGEGPEIIVQSMSGEPLGKDTPCIVFDYYNAAHVFRLMVSTALHVHSNAWYVMKVFVSGTRIRCYINEMLIFDTTDSNIVSFTSYRILVGGYILGESGYIDYVKIYRADTIAVNGLKQGQKIELYDVNHRLIASDVVEAGESKAILDICNLAFPFSGYFKIYTSDGITILYRTQIYEDIWGGDEYAITQ
jgi:hypothetical protein